MKNNTFHQKEYKIFKVPWVKVSSISVLVLILFLLSSKIWAQYRNNIYSSASLAEKIYLQLDGKVYTTGNIVWFKSIVTSAYTHFPSSLSRVLYVELISPDERILEKKLIKLENGIGEGFFYLDKNLQNGQYLIRAYTEWNKNFGTDFFFEEYIRIFTPKTEEEVQVMNITLNRENADKSLLKASINPFVVDSLHKDVLTVFITLDNKKDSLKVRRDKNNQYRFEYETGEENQFATIQIKTSNNQTWSKSIVLNPEYLDLQFFPESGELVHGLTSKVGIKAFDAHGRGKMVQGDIVDNRDSVVASFKSNTLGMGCFEMINADSTKTYFARLEPQPYDNQILLYPLPAVASVGNVLSVSKADEEILVTIRSNYLTNDSVWLRVSLRGVGFFEKKYALINGELSLTFNGFQFPEGIIVFTLLDNTKQPVAERLWFNEEPENRINIELSTNKAVYAKRELTELKIKTTDTFESPVEANLSLLVINKNQLGAMQKKRQNILSWFLLDSELRGEIENPGFYFNHDSCTHEHLDALMLTQGWRKYHYARPFNDLVFKPEKSLSVNGRVTGYLFTKNRKEANLTMFTFGKSQNVYSQKTDSLGNFKFILDDEDGQKMNVLIHSSRKRGISKNYTISLDKNISPPLNYNQTKAIEVADSIILAYTKKNEERLKIDEAFPMDSGNILIEEVEVKAYKLTPARKLVMKRYGEPDVIIDGKEILEKEQKWSYGLYSVLIFNFPGQVRIYDYGDNFMSDDPLSSLDSTRDDFMYAHVIGSDVTLVVIDGIPAKIEDYANIPYIPPSEVNSFEIIKCSSGFPGLYMEVNEHPPPPGLLCGSVIAIYTKAGKGIMGAHNPKGFVKAAVPVFSAPREFYAPKYNNLHPDDWTKPDLRALINWEPIIKTDNMGNANASFYNADVGGKMMIVVEAITENGEIGYREMEYEIEGKEKKSVVSD
ncbi:MAG: hypothetical protein WCY58_13320 [Mariniphaga sp.]